ncbi:unnamed protein product [marine sediment metagenome]|uniref:Uncharacterized protein n=1 Tax=marine sediment metagenome TaxID=412755 RepID=X1MJY0_9ZZZZ
MGKLSYKEQLYWKSYNINPEKGMSSTGFKRAFLGQFSDPDNPDLYFKMRYKQFNENWNNKFGWFLFKPLSKEDEHYFSSFHLLTSENNEKALEILRYFAIGKRSLKDILEEIIIKIIWIFNTLEKRLL